MLDSSALGNQTARVPMLLPPVSSDVIAWHLKDQYCQSCQYQQPNELANKHFCLSTVQAVHTVHLRGGQFVIHGDHPQHSRVGASSHSLLDYMPFALRTLGMSIVRTETWEAPGQPVQPCSVPLRPLDELDETVPCERILTS